MRRCLLHLFQPFRNKRADQVGGAAAVGEGLVEVKRRKRQAGQGGLQIVAGIDAYGAVENVNAMMAHPPSPRQKRGRRMTEDARLAVIVFEEMHVARPQQSLGLAVAWMLSLLQTGVHVKRIIIFVIQRQLTKKFQLMRRNLFAD